MRQEKLDSAVAPVVEQLPGVRSLERGEDFLSLQVINRPPIIRIDQTEIPDLVPLINIRDPGRRQFEQDLRERVDRAHPRHLASYWNETFEKAIARRGIENPRNKICHRRVPLIVRLDPARVEFGLFHGL